MIRSRWYTPRRPYSGDWRQNPWINGTDSRSQALSEAGDDDAQELQQQAAIRTWEDEGGSICADGN